jgi:hypothetical protein
MTCFYRVLRVVHWIFKKLYPGIDQKPPVSTHSLPWFWIGATINNETVDVTELVNQSAKNYVAITPEVISEIAGYEESIEWKYIDALTLEEKEIPSSGIVIENA